MWPFFGLKKLKLKDFTKIFQSKGLKPKNKDHANFYECSDLTKKVYLVTIYYTFRMIFYSFETKLSMRVHEFFFWKMGVTMPICHQFHISWHEPAEMWRGRERFLRPPQILEMESKNDKSITFHLPNPSLVMSKWEIFLINLKSRIMHIQNAMK